MKSKLTKIIITIIAIFSLSTIFITPTAFAYNICTDSKGVDPQVLAAAGCDGSVSTVDNVIVNVVKAIIGVLGVVALIFVLIGGINYMTAAGDSGKLKTAKSTILYALIGLAICALSFAIVNFATNIINNSQSGLISDSLIA